MQDASKIRTRAGLLAVPAAVLCLAIASPARAADSIYWVNQTAPTISRANLSGGGGSEFTAAGAVGSPGGIAIDSAAGKIYWTEQGRGVIVSANLDGTGAVPLNTTGAVIDTPHGLAIDPIARRIFWANFGLNTISFASLNGSGGGQVITTGATIDEPTAVVVDTRARRVYWANAGAATISFANLDGSGGGDLDTGIVPVAEAEGLAIDPAANRLYWTSPDNQLIGFVDLGGNASGSLNTGGAPVDGPVGVAIDHRADRIYWTNVDNNTIGFASLSGLGARGSLDISGATSEGPSFPILLETPAAATPPAADGKGRGGATLTCQAGGWATDIPESFLYRAPQTVGYQWLLNGRPLAGATAQAVRANRVGRYACQTTATNFAGSDTAMSGEVTVKAALKLGRVRLNRKTGTATLAVAAAGVGKLKLTGAGIRRRVGKAGRKAHLRIQPTGKAGKRLGATGKARVKATVAFLPTGGKPIRRSKTIALRLKLSR
jgi:DNA-binding beta-propeller fold protein YncE